MIKAKEHLIDTKDIIRFGTTGVIKSLYLIAKNIPNYLSTPAIISIELTLFYFYQLFYPKGKYLKELHDSGWSPPELTYGETPYSTLERALKFIPIKKSDFFVDLGCGHGKLVFYMNLKYKIKSAGIDLIPTFITVASKLAEKRKLKKIKFQKKDFLKLRYPRATIIFVTCTCFQKKNLIALTKKLETLKKGAHVISISAPIKSRQFKKVTKFKAPTSWGTSEIYIQKKLTDPTA